MSDRKFAIRGRLKRLRLTSFQLTLIIIIFILLGILHVTSPPADIPSISDPPRYIPSGAAIVSKELHPQVLEVFAKYDPVINKELADERSRHVCDVTNPTQESIELYKFDWTLTRYVMNYNIYLFLRDYIPSRGGVLDALDFGGTKVLSEFPQQLNVTKTSYPGVDIHRTGFASESFDIVAADQVFEHIVFPHLAMVEIHRLLKPGGVAIITSCAYNPLHEVWPFHDHWRFMVDGMKVLSMPFEGGIKVCGGWGTVRAVTIRAEKGMSGGDWRTFRDIRDEEIQKNDRGNPFTTWLVAQK